MSYLIRGRRPQIATVGLALSSALALGLAGISAAVASPGAPASEKAASAAPSSLTAGHYVVLLKQASAATYKGGTDGIAATSPSVTGTDFRAKASSTARYTSLLKAQQSDVAKDYGVSVDDRYTVAVNGFSADLSKKQAIALQQDKRVLMVSKDALQKPDAYQTTPEYFGLNGSKGLWLQNGGAAKAGDGVVIADIDTGIWPEAPSFKGTRLTSTPQGPWDVSQEGDATRMEKKDGGLFTGRCEAGPEFPSTTCNTKVIGARVYGDGFLKNVGGESGLADYEYLSARDGGGHGSHTASTAAGNVGVSTTVVDTTYKNLAGMAPGAKIAVYKVCWSAKNPDDDGCTTSDILAAIDDVIQDNADVINFSIGGGASSELGPDDIAFEAAAEAGIFVAASAGNSGPGATTLDHAGPWLTTVAASTSYNAENTVVLGDGTKLAGASLASRPVPSTSLVSSTSVKLATAADADANLCKTDTLDPAKAAGKIVVCTRGVNARTEKSAEVKRAGGIAMVLINAVPSSLDSDAHVIPTVHLSDVDGKKVTAYLASAGANAKASFVLGNLVSKTPIPQVAGFSSRGPTDVAGGDVLKPDIAAPGVSVLAAVAPPSNGGRAYDFYSGTSMAAPHIAGLAAFLIGKHPTWGPMTIKSAMMTTATPTRTPGGYPSSDVFAQGAGEVDPAAMFDPGLFITSRPQEWKGFLANQGYNTGVKPIGANEINTPALAEGSGAGPITFTRTVSAQKTGTWKIASTVKGFTLKTSPSTIVSKRKGDLITVKFTFTRTTAKLASYAKGYVTLTGPTSLKLPVALRPVAVDAPKNVSGSGAEGTKDVTVNPGVTGDLDLTLSGLAKADTVQDAVAANDDNLTCVTVADGAKFARFDLDATDADADLDLTVYAASSCSPADITGVAGSSATASGDERVDLEAPDAGTYIVDVNGYTPGASGSPIPYRLDTYVVDGSSTLGSFTATPNPVPVTTGTPATFTLGWTGLDAGARYLGLVDYEGALAPTVLTVDVPPAG